jgi:hypothetical protein
MNTAELMMLITMKAIAKPTAHQPSRVLGCFKKEELELAIFYLLFWNKEKRSFMKPDGLRSRSMALERAWRLACPPRFFTGHLAAPVPAVLAQAGTGENATRRGAAVPRVQRTLCSAALVSKTTFELQR